MRVFPKDSGTYYCPGCNNEIIAEDPITEKFYHSNFPRAFTGYSDSLGDVIYQTNKDLEIAKCENCNTIFWMRNLKKYRKPQNIKSNENEVTFDSFNDKEILFYDFDLSIKINSLNDLAIYKREITPSYVPVKLNINDYFKVLKTFELNKNDEFKIRLSIWWAYNDRIRFQNRKKLYSSEKVFERWSDNVIKLMNLLDETNDINKFILAELNRNLGRFDECIRIANTIESIHYQKVKETLIHECEIKNKMLVRIGGFTRVRIYR